MTHTKFRRCPNCLANMNQEPGELEQRLAEVKAELDCYRSSNRTMATELSERRERLAEAEAKLAVASSFCDVRKCRGCDGYYPDGYVCQCGEDNSYE